MENLPRGRRSRRSSSNLNLTNISPLTTHFSLANIESAFDDNAQNAVDGHRYSYIQGVSAPSTPSILSRAPSRKRPSRVKPALSVPGTPRADLSDLQKSKSAGHLLLQERRTSYFDPHNPHQHIQIHHRSSRPRRNESTEWVHRAGIALTSEARESKGQSWLTRRASSTNILENESSDEDEFSKQMRTTTTRRGSQPEFGMTSIRTRNSSDASLRRKSRSRSNLHVDIPYQGAHPLAPEFIDETFMGSTFDDDDEEFIREGDVDDEDEDEEDLHWSNRPRTGVGAWVDRMVGWSLFSVDEEYGSDDEQQQQQHVVVVRAEGPPRLTLPNVEGSGEESSEAAVKNQQLEDVSAWADAGWVLSLAAKALF